MNVRKQDLLWALASPLYLVLGTIRHEGSHALVGLSLGAKIERFVCWPSRGHWGYVQFHADPPIPALAAPYIVDVLLFSVCAWWCRRIPRDRHALWINVFIIGLLSPAVDSAYSYTMAFVRGGDVAGLFQVFPWYAMHLWFLAFATAAVVVLALELRRFIGGPNAQPDPSAA